MSEAESLRESYERLFGLTVILLVYLVMGFLFYDSWLSSGAILLLLSVVWINNYPFDCLVLHGGRKTDSILVGLGAGFLLLHFITPVREYGESLTRNLALGLIVAAPFAEEFFFRGILFDHLQRNLGARAAWLLSAVLFGGLHHSSGSAVSGFILGLLAGGAVLRTRSVVAAMAVHVFWNAAVLLFDADQVSRDRILLTTLATLLSLYLFSRFVRKGTHEAPSSDVVGPAA